MNKPVEQPAPGKAVVIGSGFGGLAVALRLLADGWDVEVLERHEDIGGRARVFQLEGVAFDAGPTVITAPFLFEALFERFGESLYDHVTLLPVEPFYRMDFADGSYFDYGCHTEQIIAEIERLCPGEGNAYHDFLAATEKMYQRGFVDLAEQPFTRVTDMLKVLPDLVRLRADISLYGFVSRFFHDERLRRAFSVPSLLVGGHPFRTSSLYGLIHALERRGGVWYPEGGTGALVQALAALFKRHGGVIRTRQQVTSLSVQESRIVGVQVASGDAYSADIVVSNVDPLHVYEHWLPLGRWGRLVNAWRRNMKQSMGLMVVYFTTRRAYPALKHHTILFGDTFREILDAIFERHEMPDDLSLYLHRPGATDPHMAPADGDAFYVLVPVPNLQGDQDWESLEPVLSRHIFAMLKQRLMPDLDEQLGATHTISPRYFYEALSSPFGSGFSIAPTLTQSAGLRFHNRSPHYPNLYFVGAGTHPGAGVPGVVSSAGVVERLVREDTASMPTGVSRVIQEPAP
ncbi:phytoene desaturase family protein [Vreelandella gomseomensis]|uniref:Phytoene dehydrogenase n=1 Tax=Vreelandella gomseomensis TaxID=370766 RepID=A0ABU1GE42_9GAMM|nr:phytoene desaturase family protein [Halomonas gomseomensis]MDR5875752.1 phytoene desaturase family protein [Halomonas gomseomensis]